MTDDDLSVLSLVDDLRRRPRKPCSARQSLQDWLVSAINRSRGVLTAYVRCRAIRT